MDRLSAPEASVAEKFDRVREAGFDGMAIDLGALTMEQAEATVPHFVRTGLAGGLTAFPTSIEALRPALLLAHRIAAPFVVVIGQEMPIKLADMVPVIEGWLRVAEQEAMPIQFETHRNCITNDLFTTAQLLDEVPAMRLAADLSHYVVDREMPCPPPPALQKLITKVLERSDSFQGRVAARGQIQVALNFPQNAKWVALFRDWWRQGSHGMRGGIRRWSSCASSGRTTTRSPMNGGMSCRIGGRKPRCWRNGRGRYGAGPPAARVSVCDHAPLNSGAWRA